MSSSYTMFEASVVYFQYVSEQVAHVKIDRDSLRYRPHLGGSNSLISLVIGWF